MPIDFKKTEKDLYQPKATPSIVTVPEMTFIVINGKGDNLFDPQGGATRAEFAAMLYRWLTA
jgi:hypothetical protein